MLYKDIPSYEGIYQIGEDGSVLSLERTYYRSDTGTPVYVPSKILKPTVDKYGYLCVYLSKHGENKRFRLHRLVAEAFIPIVEGKHQVNHIDGNKQNPNKSNLEWVSNTENQLHAIDMGLKKIYFGRKAIKTRYTIFAIDQNTNEIVSVFTGNEEMAEKGFDYRLVSAVCLGKRKSHRGCSFFRIDHKQEEIL